jgi:hypothetical protein
VGVSNSGRLTGPKRHAVAARLRAVLDVHDADTLGAAARRLGVAESVLKISIDEWSPYPELVVLAAVVERCGVDPSFLLTGEYDAATHRAAMEHDGDFVERMLLRMAAHDTGEHVAQPTDEPRLRPRRD